MTQRVWSFIVMLAGLVLGEGAGWLGAWAGIQGRIGRDLIVVAVFGLTMLFTRRMFGLPAYRDPYSKRPQSLTK